MEYRSEKEVKQALNIDSWRNLSRDNVLRFAAMMPDMDKEVALEVVKQFPEFRNFAKDAIGSLQNIHEKALDANKSSQQLTHQAWADIREILKGQLQDTDISEEQRERILQLLMETGREEAKKDTENKRWLKEIAMGTAGAIGAVVLAGVVVLGARATGEISERGTSEG